MTDRSPDTTKYFLKSIIYLTKISDYKEIDLFQDTSNLIVRLKLLAKFSYLEEVDKMAKEHGLNAILRA